MGSFFFSFSVNNLAISELTSPGTTFLGIPISTSGLGKFRVLGLLQQERAGGGTGSWGQGGDCHQGWTPWAGRDLTASAVLGFWDI